MTRDNSPGVTQQQMTESVAQQELCDGDAGSTGSVDHHAAVLLFLADNFERIDHSGQNNHGRAMLIIMEDRNVHRLLQSSLDLEASGRADILQIDAAERGLKQLDRPDNFVHILGGKTDRKCIDAAERLEQRAFSLHHRHCGLRPDIAETEHCRPVGDDRNRILLERIGVRLCLVRVDLLAGLGDTRCVREGQILPGLQLALRFCADFALPLGMQFERFLCICRHRLILLKK